MHLRARCLGSASVYQVQAMSGGREQNYRWRCRACKKMYIVRTVTVMEEPRLPIRVWVFAFGRYASKKASGRCSSRARWRSRTRLPCSCYAAFATMSAQASAPQRATGTVDADEIYVSGKLRVRAQ
jgi:hypothetical protein